MIVAAMLMAAVLVTSPGPVAATESGTNSISRFFEGTTRGSSFNAMTLDPSGNPVVVFKQVRDDGRDSLMLLSCNDPDCVGGGDTFTEIAYGSVVGGVSIGVRPTTGVPVVSYVGRNDGFSTYGLHILDLADKFEACAGRSCIDRFPTTVVGRPDATHTSLVVGDTGVYVAYNDETTRQVHYARCIESGCESEANPIRSITNAGLGRNVNLAFTYGGPLPVATLTYNGADGRVTVARCNDELCTAPTVNSLETGSEFGSLALDSNGNPAIAYRWRDPSSATNSGVKLVTCNDPACADGDDGVTTLYPSSGVVQSVQLVLSRDDHPRVGFNLLSGQLVVVSCSTTTCSDRLGEVVQGVFLGADGEEDWSRNGPGGLTKDLGYYLSMTLDENGWLAMSHVALNASDLWVVRCGSETCVEDPAPPPDCGVGTFSATGVEPCDDAPAGSYVAETGATAATPCATGSYQPLIGQSSCDPAPVGSFVDTAGATAATLCLAGTFSADLGAVACTDAPAGSFVDTEGATAATRCATGSYQPLTGQLSCETAPVGSFVDTKGATAATACPVGQTTAETGSVSVGACYPIDTDGDGVPDLDDLCPGTVLPDAPTEGLKSNRFAATLDGFASTDDVVVASLADTGGCSGTQIIAELGLGSGHTKFGVTRSALQDWIDTVNA